MKLWDRLLRSRLLPPDYSRNRGRIGEWLKDNGGTLPGCALDFDLSEDGADRDDVKRLVFKFLASLRHRPVLDAAESQPLATAMILSLSRFADFAVYAKAVSKKSRGNDNAAVKRAARLGYRSRLIEHDAYLRSIDGIRRSKMFRTGGPVLDAFRWAEKVADRPERLELPPPSPDYWMLTRGVFKDDRLVAYLKFARCGNIVRTVDLMGHRDALRDGVMKLLMFDTVRSFIEPDAEYLRGIRFFLYGAAEHGGDGLFEWKLRLQFEPALPDMTEIYRTQLPEGFDAETYYRRNPDVRKFGMHAGMHYLAHGKAERRQYR